MPQDGTEHRKLAAIMFTDMVGYSTLVERNEALALELLEEHQRLLRKRTYVQPTYLVFVHASLGNHDEAFACFAQGLEHENGSLAYLGEYCIFAGLDRLRADARFPALLKKNRSRSVSADAEHRNVAAIMSTDVVGYSVGALPRWFNKFC